MSFCDNEQTCRDKAYLKLSKIAQDESDIANTANIYKKNNPNSDAIFLYYLSDIITHS